MVQIQLEFAEESYIMLRDAGVNVTFISYPGIGHSTSPNGFKEVTRFLQAQLAEI